MLERLKTAKEDASDIVRLVKLSWKTRGFSGLKALREVRKDLVGWGHFSNYRSVRLVSACIYAVDVYDVADLVDLVDLFNSVLDKCPLKDSDGFMRSLGTVEGAYASVLARKAWGVE